MTTRLAVESWEAALMSHPDRAYVGCIIQGLQEGFRIGFQRGAPLRAASANMPSSRLRPSVITDYLTGELGKNRMIGSLPMS